MAMNNVIVQSGTTALLCAKVLAVTYHYFCTITANANTVKKTKNIYIMKTVLPPRPPSPWPTQVHKTYYETCSKLDVPEITFQTTA